LLSQLRAGPEQKKRPVEALNKAVGHLLDTARKATARASDAARETIARLSDEVKGLAAGISSTEDVFSHYAESASLLELFRLTHVWLDPNRWFDQDTERLGAFSTPVSVLDGTRSAVRERVLAIRALYPDRLVLMPNTLATEVLIENNRAVGV